MTDNFNELLFGFKEHLKVKNYSKASIGHYTQTHLQGFFEYLRANNITDIRGVTRDILKAYQLKITEYRAHGKGYTVSTISVKIRGCKEILRIPRSLEPDPCQSCRVYQRAEEREPSSESHSYRGRGKKNLRSTKSLDKGRDKRQNGSGGILFHRNKT